MEKESPTVVAMEKESPTVAAKAVVKKELPPAVAEWRALGPSLVAAPQNLEVEVMEMKEPQPAEEKTE